MNIGIQICYYIILLVVLYYFSGLITSRFKYFTLFDWWNTYSSLETKETFDPTSIALYNKTKYSFNIHKLFIKSQLNLTENEILFLQQMVLNNLFAVDSYGNAQPDRFIKPKHLSRTICWNNEDTEIWPDCGVKDLYGNTNWYLAIIGGNKVLSPDDPKWSTSSLYISGSTPDNTFKSDVSPGGFWPNRNGCVGFFDTPPLATDSTPTTDKMLNAFNAIDNFPEVGQNKYVPGFPGGLGSWAQLFADWGIVYTNYGPNGFSNVPVISSGQSCYGLSPCPDYCKTGDEDVCTSTNKFPESDLTLWNKSTSNSEGRPGINFFALNKINPASFLITSWVAGIYNDSNIRNMIFDSGSIPNLLGTGIILGYGRITGGWLRFIKCLNIKKMSVDKIINQMCREYSSSLNPYYIPPDNKNCKTYSGLTTGAEYTSAIIDGAGMGPEVAPFMIPYKLIQLYLELKGENKC